MQKYFWSNVIRIDFFGSAAQ